MFTSGMWRTRDEYTRLSYAARMLTYSAPPADYDIDRVIRSSEGVALDPAMTISAGVLDLLYRTSDWQQRPGVPSDTSLAELVGTYNKLEPMLPPKSPVPSSCLWYEGWPGTGEGWECLPKEPVQEMEAFSFKSPSPSDVIRWRIRSVTRYVRGAGRRSAPKSPIGSIEDIFALRDRTVVTDFLSEHQDLIPILADAALKIRQADFFPTAKLSLEFFVDPEDDDDSASVTGRLTIVISTDLSPEEAFNRHRSLQDRWWLDVFVQHGDRLGLDVEFL